MRTHGKIPRLDEAEVKAIMDQETEAREALPLHVRDQFDAAANYSMRRAHQTVPGGGAETTPVGEVVWTPFLLGVFTDLFDALDSALCPHLHTAQGPEPALLTRHGRPLLMCEYCYDSVKFVFDDVEARRCDACSVVQDGPEMWSCLFVVGGVTVIGAYCDDCRIESEVG